MTDAVSISVAEVLQLLDGPFASFAQALQSQQYALWVGAGISRDRVPDVGGLVLRVLEHLRSRTNRADPLCRYGAAFAKCLELAELGALEKEHVDYSTQVEHWAIRDELVQRLTNRYAQLLNIRVDGEAIDYLLWEAVGVAATYAPAVPDPDCEHLCLAILIMEGAVANIVSTNWDGLIEAGVAELAGHSSGHALRVCVRSEDLAGPETSCKLYKIHGCAVLARDDPDTYRPLLVARSRQIVGWTGDYWSDAAKSQLVNLAATTRTLMVGLSAQDSNIQWLFVAAAAQTQWSWPTDPSGHVFGEDRIGDYQRSILDQSYRDVIDEFRVQIEGAALLRAFAKPLLVGLVLDLLEAKLATCVELVPASLSDPDRVLLQSGLRHLRDLAARCADANRLDFIRSVVTNVYRVNCLLHDGRATSAIGGAYRPITRGPATALPHDHDLPSSGLLEFAVALGAIGLGHNAGMWGVALGEPTSPASGAIRLSASSAVRIFFAASHLAALTLFSEVIDPADCNDVVVLHSGSVPAREQRSPEGTFGRSGSSGVREFSMRAALVECSNSDELVRRLQEAVGV